MAKLDEINKKLKDVRAKITDIKVNRDRRDSSGHLLMTALVGVEIRFEGETWHKAFHIDLQAGVVGFEEFKEKVMAAVREDFQMDRSLQELESQKGKTFKLLKA